MYVLVAVRICEIRSRGSQMILYLSFQTGRSGLVSKEEAGQSIRVACYAALLRNRARGRQGVPQASALIQTLDTARARQSDC